MKQDSVFGNTRKQEYFCNYRNCLNSVEWKKQRIGTSIQRKMCVLIQILVYAVIYLNIPPKEAF